MVVLCIGKVPLFRDTISGVHRDGVSGCASRAVFERVTAGQAFKLKEGLCSLGVQGGQTRGIGASLKVSLSRTARQWELHERASRVVCYSTVARIVRNIHSQLITYRRTV